MLRPACLPSLSNFLQQGGIAPHQLQQLLTSYSDEVQFILAEQINHYHEPELWIDAKTWQQTVDEFGEALRSETPAPDEVLSDD
ncbi:hypothetical protein ACS5NO_20745 [Larkinella sp. GY13]|uniref:hypothetical protein n=1 Tax=Larkinella sp. GY13 TaxID=3453720 RepID=UPI003EE97C21